METKQNILGTLQANNNQMTYADLIENLPQEDRRVALVALREMEAEGTAYRQVSFVDGAVSFTVFAGARPAPESAS